MQIVAGGVGWAAMSLAAMVPPAIVVDSAQTETVAPTTARQQAFESWSVVDHYIPVRRRTRQDGRAGHLEFT